MNKYWQAVVKIQAPTGGQKWNGNSYQYDTTGQITSFSVPDLGGYFSTKASLEAVYG